MRFFVALLLTEQDQTTGLIVMLMTGVLLLGLLRREKSGVGNIGFESVLVLVVYAGSVAMIHI